MTAALAAVACCAAPLLLGALGVTISGAAIGAFLNNPVVIVLATVVLAATATFIAVRSRRRR